MKLSEFDYELPEELIAQSPLDDRSSSRLMVVSKDIEHKHFYDIIDYLEKDDVLVMNETKVMPYQIVGKKKTGSPAELMFENIIDKRRALCRVKTKNPIVGTELLFDDVNGKIIEQDDDQFIVVFNEDIDKIISSKGRLPFPPYVKSRKAKDEQYQTVYANKEGSLAAPTAGLHFTDELLDKIREKGVKIVKVCLHVGFGTFLAMRVEDIREHKMPTEYYEVSEKTANVINNCKGKLVVVGTTTLKTLESAADNDGIIRIISGESDLFITPYYKLKTKIDMMITNFHLPKSTLLLLVSALIPREKILKAYKIAVKEKYRFFSFGDSMLLFRE